MMSNRKLVRQSKNKTYCLYQPNHYILVDKPINFNDILRTIEAGFGKNSRTTEARFDFTGPYKKKKCNSIDLH